MSPENKKMHVAVTPMAVLSSCFSALIRVTLSTIAAPSTARMMMPSPPPL
jgi:hypothetical protein